MNPFDREVSAQSALAGPGLLLPDLVQGVRQSIPATQAIRWLRVPKRQSQGIIGPSREFHSTDFDGIGNHARGKFVTEPGHDPRPLDQLADHRSRMMPDTGAFCHPQGDLHRTQTSGVSGCECHSPGFCFVDQIVILPVHFHVDLRIQRVSRYAPADADPRWTVQQTEVEALDFSSLRFPTSETRYDQFRQPEDNGTTVDRCGASRIAAFRANL